MTSNTREHTKPFRIVVFGGGTIVHIRNHMALCAPAYGGTAKKLASMLQYSINEHRLDLSVDLMLTKMANPDSQLETNDDVEHALQRVLADPYTAGIIFNVALCDFSGTIGMVPSGKYAARLQTREVSHDGLPLVLHPTKKLLGQIAAQRPDIVSIGFKTTANESSQVQMEKSNRMSLESNVSWILANDTVTRNNIVLPNGKDNSNKDVLYNGNDRNQALRILGRAFLKCVAPTYTPTRT